MEESLFKLNTNKFQRKINHKLIFESPFYKKRNRVKSTFRNFSKFLSENEAKLFADRIWKQTHHE